MKSPVEWQGKSFNRRDRSAREQGRHPGNIAGMHCLDKPLHNS
ncbi:MAG TPA: hypothetical protein VGF13_13840 [Verrucomicrobiae bacterium]|jgi:hypothetical protein